MQSSLAVSSIYAACIPEPEQRPQAAWEETLLLAFDYKLEHALEVENTTSCCCSFAAPPF